MIYQGVDGVVRETEQPVAGIGTVKNLLYDGYCGVDGVGRQILWGNIQAEHVEKIEIRLNQMNIRETGGDHVLTVDLTKDADLSGVSAYGNVSIDLDTKEITITCTKRGYSITVSGSIFVFLKTGQILDLQVGHGFGGGSIKWNYKLLETMTFHGKYYMSASGGVYGRYEVKYGDKLTTGEYSGSISGDSVVTPAGDSAAVYMKSGIETGSGSHITRMTMQEITIGGVAFVPEMKYGG